MCEEKAIQKYIDENKELQNLILQIINKSEAEDDTIYQQLIIFLDTYQYEKNKPKLERYLHLISNISANHHRGPNFFEKIEKILTISSKYYTEIFSNVELFSIFQQNKPILLFLVKSKIVLIDQIIFDNLINFQESIEGEVNYYFYPELYSVIKSGTIENVTEENYKLQFKEDIENFERNRQNYENEYKLCSLIRDDSVSDFIQYINERNLSFSTQIKRSFFETNSMFIEKDPTLIEYAAFFGSIQILKYLVIKDVELEPSIWLYAVHSDNAEIIQF